MVANGFYFIKNDFFSIMQAPYLKENKNSKRPFYYCFKEDNSDIYWMIPLSSRVDKYKKLIAKRKEQNKPCHGIHILTFPTGRESVFLIQDIFPVTEKYIDRAYTIGNIPLYLLDKNEIATINDKAKTVLRLSKKGIKLTPTSPDIWKIYTKLTKE